METKTVEVTKTEVKQRPKPVEKKRPSVFDQPAWIVDNDTMHDLESGRLHSRRQHSTAILTFSNEPKRWGTLLSKIVEAIKDNGQIYFPNTMSKRFLLVNATPQKGRNAERFWYTKVRR